MAKARKGFYVHLPTPSGVQRWRVAYRKLRDNWGEVDWKKKTIWLHPNQTNAGLAGTLIHEIGGHVSTGLNSDPAAIKSPAPTVRSLATTRPIRRARRLCSIPTNERLPAFRTCAMRGCSCGRCWASRNRRSEGSDDLERI